MAFIELKNFIKQNRSLLLTIFGLASLLAAIQFIQFYFHYQAANQEFPWATVFIGHFGTSYIFALYSFTAIFLAKRVRLTKVSSKQLVLHLFFSIVFSFTFLFLSLIYNRLIEFSPMDIGIWQLYQYTLTHNSHIVVLGYWAVVGITMAFEYLSWYKASEGERIGQLEKLSEDHSAFVSRILLKERGLTKVVELDEVEWIEAFDNYVKLHCVDRFYLIRKTMKSITDDLNPQSFCRIHRSFIVNLNSIRSLKKMRNGDAVLTLGSGIDIRVSRKFRPNLETALSKLTSSP